MKYVQGKDRNQLEAFSLFDVTNQNDSKAMGAMVRRAKTILGKSDFTALYDKGYHTGTEFDYAHKHAVDVIVAFPETSSHAPDIAYDVEHFQYNKSTDAYTCPAGQLLTTNGRWYNKQNGKTTNRVKHYKTPACLTCSHFANCTINKKGRLIERSEHIRFFSKNFIPVTIRWNPHLQFFFHKYLCHLNVRD